MYKILKLENNKFEEIELETRIVDYEELNKAIGGYIEHITFNSELENAKIDVWCDEEGKLKNLSPQCIIVDLKAEKVIDVIAGPLVFTGANRLGLSLALTEEQIKIIKKVIDSDGVFPIMPYR